MRLKTKTIFWPSFNGFPLACGLGPKFGNSKSGWPNKGSGVDCDLWRLEFNSDSSEAILNLEGTTLLIWWATPFADGGVALKTHNFGPQFFLEFKRRVTQITHLHTQVKNEFLRLLKGTPSTTRLPSFGGGC